MWFLKFLFFSLTFSFVTPFFFSWGRSQPETPGQEYGECSWYGPAKSTYLLPTGLMSPTAFYAAHKTLPLGSNVVITNADTGKTTTVRVTDRGPIVYGRIAAMSQAAFEELADLDQKVFPCYVSPAK